MYAGWATRGKARRGFHGPKMYHAALAVGARRGRTVDAKGLRQHRPYCQFSVW